MITFSNTEHQLTNAQILEMEKFTGLIFPHGYKKHLLKYNGGQCHPNIFKYIKDGKPNASDIDWFLAIYDGEYDNLEKEIIFTKIEEKRLPFHILPIAHDSGGNLICISCGKFDYGYIYFWDHENEVDYNIADDTDYSNLYFIASSFNEFLEALIDEI